MEAIKLNEAQILTEAWKRYITNYSKGLSFKCAYNIAEVEAKNEALAKEDKTWNTENLSEIFLKR